MKTAKVHASFVVATATVIAVIILSGARARAQGLSDADQLFEAMMTAQADDAFRVSMLASSPAATTLQDVYTLDAVNLGFSYSVNTGQYINGVPISLSCSGTGAGDGTFAWTTEIQVGDLIWDASSTAANEPDPTQTSQSIVVYPQPGGQIIIDYNTDTTVTTQHADRSIDSVTTRSTAEYSGVWSKPDPKTGKSVPVRQILLSTVNGTQVGTDHKAPPKVVEGADASNWWVADPNSSLFASGGAGTAIMDISAVPEPSTSALLGIGAIGLLGYVARRRKEKA